MKYSGSAFLAGGLLALAACAVAADKPGTGARADEAAVVKGNNEFALDLYAQLRTHEGNLFFSPNSISTALAMTYAGARGQTAGEMAKTLHFTLEQDRLPAAYATLVKELNAEDQKRAYQLRVANALWGQKGYPFRADFLKITHDNYGAGLREIDFAASEAARRTINTWVEKETNDKIKDLIPSGVLSGDTRLVLTNAIYFKGKWARPFKKSQTRDDSFFVAADKKAIVPMMNDKADFKYLDQPEFQALELPYKGKDLSMVVLLPRKVGDLARFDEHLTAAKLADWLPRMQTREVVVTLPKFKMTAEFQLQDILARMGMPSAFDPNKADFSGMDGKKDLFVSAVIHKAFVDVNEEGTEAAAGTAVEIAAAADGGGHAPATFRADHPFVFGIRDNRNGSILFLGRVVNPKAEG